MASRKGAWLGFLAGVMSRLTHRSLPKITPTDLKKHDHPANTQRLGLRFTERVRDTFRFKWIKRHS